MKLIIGLGNPGKRYENSRHNIGFTIVKGLAKTHNIIMEETKYRSLLGMGIIGKERVILAYPLTYMNYAGKAVAELIESYNVILKDLFVICDDIDLNIGRLRIRTRGSSGGHKGLESIINSVGSDSFPRFRIGIGRPSRKEDVTKYVLSAFDVEQKRVLVSVVMDACIACETWIDKGIQAAMNKFN